MGWLKSLFEWYLDVPPAAPGQGTNWRFDFQPPWPAGVPLWLVAVGGLGLVAAIVGVYWRDTRTRPWGFRLGLLGLRLAVVGLLLVLLTGLAITIERTGLPWIAIMVDTSASMGLEDRYQDAAQAAAVRRLVAGQPGASTRLDLVRALLLRDQARFLERLQRHHRLRVYRFDDTTRTVGPLDAVGREAFTELTRQLNTLLPDGRNTKPGPALRRVLDDFRGTPPSAIVIFTDGITTTGPADRLSAAAPLARNRLVPVFTVGTGSQDPARDLHLYDMQADEVAFVDDPLAFTARLKSFGFEDQQVTVHLRRADSSETLASRTVHVTRDSQALPVEIVYAPPEEGEFDFVIDAVASGQESNRANNTQSRHVSVRRERIRVLLVDSVPRWEFRYVKHLLERDPGVELTSVLQEADPEYVQEDSTAIDHVPVQRDELFEYDVIIFGDVNPQYLSTGILENLRDFVREARGGVIFVAGPRYNPLAYQGSPIEVLLPIDLARARWPASDARGGFQARLTIEGQRWTTIFRLAETEQASREVFDSLPPLEWLFEAPRLKPGAVAFAEAAPGPGRRQPLPIIVVQHYGAGKVLFHATDDLWRWRLRHGDRFYGRYWLQAIRYLSRARLLGQTRVAELTASRQEYEQGEPVHLRLRYLDDRRSPAEGDEVVVMVERHGEAARELRLQPLPGTRSVFEGTLSRAQAGSFHAWVRAPTFDDSPPTADFRVAVPDRELVRRALDVDELTRTAVTTHGRFTLLADAAGLLDLLPTGNAVPLETDAPILLWNRIELMLLFAGLLLAEWLLRKRCRLI